MEKYDPRAAGALPAPISLSWVMPLEMFADGPLRARAMARGMYSASLPEGQRMTSAPGGSSRIAVRRARWSWKTAESASSSLA